jgi:hypothetical protein
MQEFPIAPAGFRAAWLIALVLVPVFVIVIATLIGARTAQFEVSPEGLRLRGDLWGRMIPADQLRTDMAARVDFTAQPDLAPRRRTLGTGLPGYSAGWFRLRNGQKALLYLTDRSRAVYVPTTSDYSVLLSPEDPDAFLQALRSIGSSQR